VGVGWDLENAVTKKWDIWIFERKKRSEGETAKIKGKIRVERLTRSQN
jgi:hypothetical protein